jgi:hypothetical protein
MPCVIAMPVIDKEKKHYYLAQRVTQSITSHVTILFGAEDRQAIQLLGARSAWQIERRKA